MRKLCVIAVLILVAAVFAPAQDKVQVFGGYQFMNIDVDGVTNGFLTDRHTLHGWDADVTFRAAKHFSVVSEISGNYGTIFGEDVKVHQFLFGPRVSFRNDKTVVPFVQGLFGATHGSIGGSGESHFGTAFGGGVDVKVSKHVAVRVAKFDYNWVRYHERSLNNFRFASGLVFRFGE